jgi:ABC-2 type transport system permease protein
VTVVRRAPSALRSVALIARRELAAQLRAPIAYVVGVLFLAVQGVSFAALVTRLSDPARPAPLGAVLEGHFGGTLLGWALALAIVPLLTMRLCAEDRRAGTWEVLVTAPVGDGAAVVGKWLGATGFYALLWLPSLAYLIVLARYLPAGADLDLGPVVTGYLGVWLVGAGLLALGTAASAATASQIVAGALAFGAAIALLLVGELDGLAPDWLADHPLVAAAAAWLSPRAHLASFARGEVTAAALAFVGTLIGVGLSAATTAAGWGRRRRGESRARLLATALVALIGALAGALAVRHPRTWDATADGRHTLRPGTALAIAGVSGPVSAWVVEPSAPTWRAVFDEVDRALARIARAQPLIAVRRFDPALTEGGLAAIATDARLGEDALTRQGAIILGRGARRRVIDLFDLIQVGTDALGAPAITDVAAEDAIARALAELEDGEPAVVCATTGHGELPWTGTATSWGGVRARLVEDGLVVTEIGAVDGGVPARCRVLAIAGPTRPLAPDEVFAIRDWTEAGGALVVALASGDGAIRDAGLEPLLATWGVDVARAVADDPSAAIGVAGGFAVGDGYADDPLTRGFVGGRRLTAWVRPRVLGVRPVRGITARALVSTTAAGRGTTASGALLPGPIAIAVVARLPRGTAVVFGSAESMSTAVAGRGLGAGDLLAASAIARLAGRDRTVAVAEHGAPPVRLVMTSTARTGVVALCAGLIPLGYAVLGLLVLLLRRRRA